MSKAARLRIAFSGVHPDRARTLVERHGPEGAVRRAMSGGARVTPPVAAAIAVDAEERVRQLAALGIDVVFRGDPGYPERLAVLPDAPDVLFVRGTLPDERTVAVIGTRRCTTYGRGLAREYGEAIAAAGWCLVSGLARGIDGAAHRGTVGAGGTGVAILGSGPDVIYPAEHRDLAAGLVDAGGAIISEYPPGTPPAPWRFPVRNRIISGLAEAVVVVEAGVKGGASITVRCALEHDRPVFAVPGDIQRLSSEGCNLLIRDGAQPVLDRDDLIEELSLVLGPPPGRATADNVAGDGSGGSLTQRRREGTIMM